MNSLTNNSVMMDNDYVVVVVADDDDVDVDGENDDSIDDNVRGTLDNRLPMDIYWMYMKMTIRYAMKTLQCSTMRPTLEMNI